MSVIQTIRDKYAGVTIAAIAIALIAFILIDAFSSRNRGGGLFSNRSTIGRVNGTKIDKRDFDKNVDLMKKAYNMGSNELQAMNTAWSASVDKLVMEDEYEKVGLAFSNKELNSVLFGPNPPYWLKQNFSDPNTGQYDQTKAVEYFKQIKQQKNDPRVAEFYEIYIQQQTIEQTLRQKYMALLSNSVFVPKWLAEKQMADNNAISSISYVYVPYASVADSTIKVTDDEINTYIKKHEASFKVDEDSRSISYVSFDVVPSSKDSQAVRDQIMALRNEFATTTDMKAFIERAGSDFGYDSTYHSLKAIQHAFKDSIVKAGVGNVYGPYQDQKEVVFAKVLGTKVLPDSAKVRHILIKTQDPRSGQVIRADSVAKKLADSIQLAISKGANFDSMVARFSEDEGSRAKNGVMEFGQGEMVAEFNDYAFEKPVGSKSVVKTMFGYHIMEVLGQKNPQTNYKIAYLAKAIDPSQETIDEATTEAQKFAASSRDQKSFVDNAAKLKKPVISSPDIKQFDSNVPGIGDNRQFVRWVFDNDLGDVSDPSDFKDKIVVAYINNIQKKGLMTAAKAKQSSQVEMFVRNERKAQQIISQKFKGNTLESYTQSSGSPIMNADSLSFASSFIPNVGMEPKILGIAFNRAQINKVTEPIAGANGVFGVTVKLVGAKPGAGNAQDIQKSIEGQLRSNSYNAINALRKSATIKDYRSDFY